MIRKEAESKLVIPQSALVLDQQGAYVLAVDSENKVGIKRIVAGDQRGPMLVVNSGLSVGDRVIVSGHQKVRPGILVSPTMSKEPSGRAGATAKSKKP